MKSVFKATCVADCCTHGQATCGQQVYAIATEDMDALTFATPKLVRNLCAAASAKLPIMEYEYDKVLEGLKLTADQFVDLCILCGCDYCGSIKGQKLKLHLLPCLLANVLI